MSDTLRGVLAAFALPTRPDDALIDRVDAFFALRAKWAQAHNLSGPRALRDPAGTDLADAAALAALVEADLPLVDVGAGSGVPAVLVALLRPELTVIAVEPLAKRAAFLRQAGVTYGLTRLRVERASWPVPLSGPVQVVSRAVFPVPEWPARALEGGPHVLRVHRYLAKERPEFGQPDFERTAALDYAGPDATPHRLESWARRDVSRETVGVGA